MYVIVSFVWAPAANRCLTLLRGCCLTSNNISSKLPVSTPSPVFNIQSSNSNSKSNIMQMNRRTLSILAVLSAAVVSSTWAFTPIQPITSSRVSPLFMVETVQDATSDAIERMGKSVDSVIQNMGTIRNWTSLSTNLGTVSKRIIMVSRRPSIKWLPYRFLRHNS